jgi:hypothetical protein
LLAIEGTANITVFDFQTGLSNVQAFSITESVPAITSSARQSRSLQNVTITGQVIDQALEGHRVKINWGDGTIQMLDLGSGGGGPFSVLHHYSRRGRWVATIIVTAQDDVGTTSAPLSFTLRIRR